MASRCGCAGTCACVLSVDSSLNLTGNGSGESPWLLRVVPNCASTMQCVGSSVDAPLSVTNGRLGLAVSTDADQVLTTGSDGGLYVPGCAAGAVAINDTATIDLSGAGQVGNPLTADWLGAQVAAGTTGVALTGNGQPGNPLTANWSGVSVNSLNPEMTVSGRGTPTQPLTLAWAGLPWTKIRQVNIPSIAQGVSYTFSWELRNGNGTQGIAPVPANPQQLLCTRDGAYITLVRMRFDLTATATTMGGYLQLYCEIPGGASVWDGVVNSYGASWCDLYFVDEATMTNGTLYTMRVWNNTGSPAINGRIYTTFFRISDPG